MNIDLGLLILRVGVGVAMLGGHGLPKLIKLVTEYPPQFADPIGIGILPSFLLAVFAEFFCSAALIGGVWTRLAAIPLLITMLVAVVFVHAADPWKVKELAAIYAVIYATLLAAGGGRYSLTKRFS